MTLRCALGSVLLAAVFTSTLSGCSNTLDSLGTDTISYTGNAGSAGTANIRQKVSGPDSYPNVFVSLPGVQADAVATKIETAFQQLFHPPGANAPTQIYYEQDQDQALIYDALHTDVRTEGIGLAMLITVELDHRLEFDRLWRYAKAQLQASGSAQGYFTSFCDDDRATPCLDSYGMQAFALALLLANGRWQNSAADGSYATEGLALLNTLLNGIGSTFDADSHLVREQPTLAPSDYTRSSLEMPAAYAYWAQATGNLFWRDAATAARAHLMLAADPHTGLWPMRSEFSGAAAADSPGYTAQGYRTQLNLALDALWGTRGATPKVATDLATLANTLLDFFTQQGPSYGRAYALDGTVLDSDPAQALISVNGALAVLAPSNANRKAFVQAVWDQPTPSGDNRYYEGLLYLMSMLILSGQMQVY